MTVKSAYSFGLLVAPIICLLHAAPAYAQATQVFVSGQGSDKNACTLTKPCQTFQKAHDTVAAGGVIDVLDVADYGLLAISKAISIQGHGNASILVADGNTGISINVAATDAVTLNGLIIEGFGTASNFGIKFNAGRSLVVENSVVRNMTGNGIEFTSSATSLQTLSVSNSYITDNGSLGGEGMRIVAFGSGPIRASVDHVGFYGNETALDVIGTFGTGAIDAAVTDSTAANSGITRTGVGFIVQSAPGHSVSSLVLTRDTVSNNLVGIEAVAATLRLTQSTVTGNGNGFQITNGGVIFSYGDNVIDGNGPNLGTLTSASKQ